MPITTGLSGNEIYCLAQKGYDPGNIVVGNSVYSLGMLSSFKSGVKSLWGGELPSITQLIEEGRKTAFNRLMEEAASFHASGVTGITSELIFHPGSVEFLSIGSVVTTTQPNAISHFSTNSNGQELFAQIDAGYKPVGFTFGNVAYSMGIGRGIMGGLKTFRRGEIKEYSDIINNTRHLALSRIIADAQTQGANAVLGIETSIRSFAGACEMLMTGTGSVSPLRFSESIITSDMTNVEMWNMAKTGYAPLKLLLGTSVYSLGFVGGLTSLMKSFVRGEINELTRMIYDARENAIGIINDEARSIGADDVVGVKTYVYQLGGGLVEFLVIGTAVKKIASTKTQSDQLPPQAVIVDKDTFYDSTAFNFAVGLNEGSKPINVGLGMAGSKMIGNIIFVVVFALFLIIQILASHGR